MTESIKREDKSLSPSEKQISRCFFRNNEFGIRCCKRAKKLLGKFIAEVILPCAVRQRVGKRLTTRCSIAAAHIVLSFAFTMMQVT
jgi:hypothetical protein